VERATNVALLAADEHIFAREHLRGLPRYPAYYQYMAPINRRGPRVLGHFPELKPLEVEQVAARLDAGAWVVDGRDRFAFAAAHLPGSLNVELDEGFAAYVGWTVPFGAELVLVLPEPVAVTAGAAVTQLMRVGYERLAGYLAVGVAGWAAAGRQVRRYPAVAVSQLAARTDRVRLLDVRDPLEVEALPVPAALSIFVGDLPRLAVDVPRDREIWTICASGRRAAIAASLLDRAGVPVTAVARGGVAELRRCAGKQPAV
jgi:rhodanese-related sulfurtransferase